jgi:hypothetical protein
MWRGIRGLKRNNNMKTNRLESLESLVKEKEV